MQSNAEGPPGGMFIPDPFSLDSEDFTDDPSLDTNEDGGSSEEEAAQDQLETASQNDAPQM